MLTNFLIFMGYQSSSLVSNCIFDLSIGLLLDIVLLKSISLNPDSSDNNWACISCRQYWFATFNIWATISDFWIHNFTNMMFVSKQICLFCFLFQFHDIFYGSTTSGTWIRNTKSIFTVFTLLGMINPFVANK